MAKNTVTIIYNCELVNKRYDTNGNPLYDINFSYDKEGIKKDIKRVRSKINAIERSLDLLDDTQREIIECKYLLKMPLDTISDRVHKSKNQIMRDNKTAIRNMQISFFGPKAIDKESPLNHISFNRTRIECKYIKILMTM